MNFKSALGQRIDHVNEAMEQIFGKALPGEHYALIRESMDYSLLNGGKRLRPVILIEVAKILGGNVEAATLLGCALEMIHTYSLIHDDLPAMDDDAMRRGKPSNHIAFGEDIGILAGDGLLNGAYEVMFGQVLLKYPKTEYIHACTSIAEAAGSRGMILGQVADIKTKVRTTESLDYINRYKTGAILEAAFVAGGYIANYQDIEKLRLIGQCLGKGFQIQDDVLDVVGDEMALGKPTGSDLKNEKNTYVDLLGIEGAVLAYKDCYNKCIEELKAIPDSDFLIELVRYLVNRAS